MKLLLWISAIAIFLLTGCNYDEGQCWSRSEEDGQTGAGGGPIVPGGGGYGDVPPEPEPQAAGPTPPGCNNPEQQQCGDSGVASLAGKETLAYCSGTCAAKCPTGGVSGFSPSVFKFATTIPDDGKDAGGGYQVASATLSFFRWTSWIPENWTCSLTVGMPIRTKEYGTFSPTMAASITAGIASDASFSLMKITPELPPGIFCSKLVYTMRDLFKAKYPNLGASVTL